MIFLGALFFVLIGFQTTAYAGAQPVDSGTSSASDASDPEGAFLSPTRYTNAYFGFEFDLPPQAHLQPVAMQAATDRRVARPASRAPGAIPARILWTPGFGRALLTEDSHLERQEKP